MKALKLNQVEKMIIKVIRNSLSNFSECMIVHFKTILNEKFENDTMKYLKISSKSDYEMLCKIFSIDDETY